VVLGTFILLAMPAAGLRSTLEFEPKTVRLSDAVTVTLAIEGDAPLTVDVPKQVLDDTSEAVWQVRPAGPPTLRDGPQPGRQTWRQVFVAKPFVPGNPTLEFAPFVATANGVRRDVVWGQRAIAVQTSLAAANPDDARPPTDVLDADEPPPEGGDWVLPAVAVGVLVAFAAAVGYAARRKRSPVAIPPGAWFDRELSRLGDPELPAEAFAAGLGDAVRGYAERRSGVAARQRTTAEVLAELAPTGIWTAEQLADLAAVLDRCDRAKFAGQVPDAVGRQELLAAARGFAGGRTAASHAGGPKFPKLPA
jgi:hypothetical protein